MAEPKKEMTHQQCIRSSLTEQEMAYFAGFLQLCNDHGLRQRPLQLGREDVTDGLNDEATLLRFLRGRSFDTNGALRQFEEALAIRQSVNATASYDAIDIDIFEATKMLYPHWTGHRTKAGLPICFFDIAQLDPATTSGYSKSRGISQKWTGNISTSEATKHAIVFHDYLTRFVLPLCSEIGDRPNSDVPITSAVYLVDVGSLSLKQGWSLRMYAQDISKLLATCYPEVIDRVYVLNASHYFGKIWSLLSKWIDPRTASKLVIVPQGDNQTVLESEMDRSSIPSHFGGEFSFEHGMTPQLDSLLMTSLKWLSVDGSTLPRGPVKWIVDEGGLRTAVAVGADGEHKREAAIATVTGKEELRNSRAG